MHQAARPKPNPTPWGPPSLNAHTNYPNQAPGGGWQQPTTFGQREHTPQPVPVPFPVFYGPPLPPKSLTRRVPRAVSGGKPSRPDGSPPNERPPSTGPSRGQTPTGPSRGQTPQGTPTAVPSSPQLEESGPDHARRDATLPDPIIVEQMIDYLEEKARYYFVMFSRERKKCREIEKHNYYLTDETSAQKGTINDLEMSCAHLHTKLKDLRGDPFALTETIQRIDLLYTQLDTLIQALAGVCSNISFKPSDKEMLLQLALDYLFPCRSLDPRLNALYGSVYYFKLGVTKDQPPAVGPPPPAGLVPPGEHGAWLPPGAPPLKDGKAYPFLPDDHKTPFDFALKKTQEIAKKKGIEIDLKKVQDKAKPTLTTPKALGSAKPPTAPPEGKPRLTGDANATISSLKVAITAVELPPTNAKVFAVCRYDHEKMDDTKKISERKSAVIPLTGGKATPTGVEVSLGDLPPKKAGIIPKFEIDVYSDPLERLIGTASATFIEEVTIKDNGVWPVIGADKQKIGTLSVTVSPTPANAMMPAARLIKAKEKAVAKKEEPKKMEPKLPIKKEEPKIEPKKEEPKKEEPKPLVPLPKEPKKVEPKTMEPKIPIKKEEPKKEEPKTMEPKLPIKKEEPKKEEPKKMEPPKPVEKKPPLLETKPALEKKSPLEKKVIPPPVIKKEPLQPPTKDAGADVGKETEGVTDKEGEAKKEPDEKEPPKDAPKEPPKEPEAKPKPPGVGEKKLPLLKKPSEPPKKEAPVEDTKVVDVKAPPPPVVKKVPIENAKPLVAKPVMKKPDLKGITKIDLVKKPLLKPGEKKGVLIKPPAPGEKKATLIKPPGPGDKTKAPLAAPQAGETPKTASPNPPPPPPPAGKPPAIKLPPPKLPPLKLQPRLRNRQPTQTRKL
eukprot:GHVN01090033.1.p1 GENE.GHVN01090033.1~~GHVN01090033.1.p1  ORF type:complete len:892 (+),score=167.66 GHVN01090033.1:2063-4738(+)